MNPLPFNLDVLKHQSFLRFDFNRNVTVSTVGKKEAIWDFQASKPGYVGNLSRVRKLTIGSVAIEYTSSWIHFIAPSGKRWGVNTARFAGRPRLKITVVSGRPVLHLELSGARFPGLDLIADCSARLWLEDDMLRMSISFPGLSFQAETEMAGWLDGTEQASASVLLSDTICRITDGMRLTADGVAMAIFTPGWSFVCRGETDRFVALTAGGRETFGRDLVITLGAPGMPSILPDPPPRRSNLFIHDNGNFDLPLWPEQPGGWRFVTDPLDKPFAWFGLTADEQISDGRIRRALFAVGHPAAMVFFQPDGDLLGDHMGQFSLPLRRPFYCAAYLGNGKRLGAGLLALRDSLPLAMHTGSCSLSLGPLPREPLFLLLRNDTTGTTYLGPPPDSNGNWSYGLQFSLLAFVPRLGEGIIVDPLPPVMPCIMTLVLAPLNRALADEEGEIRITEGDPHAFIHLPEWSWTQAVRPRDLMVLGLQFIGLRPEFHGPQAGSLVQSPVADAPRIVFYFPPQNMTEMTVAEIEPTQGQPERLDDEELAKVSIPLPYRSAGISWLVFDLPEGATSYPLTLIDLIDWSGKTLKPRLNPFALSPYSIAELPEHELIVKRRALRRILLRQGIFDPAEEIGMEEGPEFMNTSVFAATALEAPYRLYISPDQYGCWETGPQMATGERAVLWHARLKHRSTRGKPVIRALQTVDSFAAPAPLEAGVTGSEPPTTLSKEDREDLVENCRLKPVDARQLMLTSLGAWLDLDGAWSEFEDASLIKWEHRATLGRDQFVKVIRRGFAFPTGHRLIQIKISERKFGQKPRGMVQAFLRQRVFYVVVQPELTYFLDDGVTMAMSSDEQTKELPFRRLRILTRVTPLIDIDTAQEIEPKTHHGELKGRWLRVNKKDFFFNFSGEDRQGNRVEFSAPVAFIPHDKDKEQSEDDHKPPTQFSKSVVQANVEGAINSIESGDGSRRKYQFGGQRIAFTEGMDGDSSMEAESITFTATYNTQWTPDSDLPPFFPKMQEAEVVIPALRQFANLKKDAQKIHYAGSYLKHGFDGDNSRGQVWAMIDNGSSISYDATNPADKVGGLVTPGITAGGLSRSHGVIGSGASNLATSLENFGNGTFQPRDYFSELDAKLLGGIALAAILKEVSFGMDTDSSGTVVPRWTTNREGGEIVNRLDWSTGELEPKKSFQPLDNARLTLHNEVRCNSQTPENAKTINSALLENFALNLAEMIRISFDRFEFLSESGRKPEVDVQIGGIEFCGPLKFLQVIQDNLHPDQFGDPPSLDVSPAGLVIGYSLQIPSLQVGAFALSNLALGAAATLPFNGDPFRVRFALSERQNPFLVAVSLFTGGGFFALAVGLDGVECLEVAIEFGGSFSMNLGVASGGVYVMAGIYFKQENNEAQLAGYIRAGGALRILGMVTMSLQFYLGLTYQKGQGSGKVWGEASMTVEVEVLFFSADVKLTVRREFAGDAADPTLEDTHTQEDWDNDYIAAFA
jgi:hypothetical protein